MLALLFASALALDVTHGGLNGYFTYQEANNLLDTLHNTYPGAVPEKRSVGKTWEARDIWSVEVAQKGLPLAARGTLLVMAAHHARELISVSFVLWAIERLLSEKSALHAHLLATRRIVYSPRRLIPVVNPDTYDLISQKFGSEHKVYDYRKNRRNTTECQRE